MKDGWERLTAGIFHSGGIGDLPAFAASPFPPQKRGNGSIGTWSIGALSPVRRSAKDRHGRVPVNAIRGDVFSDDDNRSHRRSLASTSTSTSTRVTCVRLVARWHETMARTSLILLGLVAGLQATGAAKLVPGKGFDRLVTIWLENQVSLSSIDTKSGSLIIFHRVGLRQSRPRRCLQRLEEAGHLPDPNLCRNTPEPAQLPGRHRWRLLWL